MDTLDSQLVAVMALTSGLGAAMVWLAARLQTLELRDTRRRCPACGVVAKRRGACRCAGS